MADWKFPSSLKAEGGTEESRHTPQPIRTVYITLQRAAITEILCGVK